VTVSAAYASYVVKRSDRARAEMLLARLGPYVKLDYRAARAAALLHAVLGDTAGSEAASAEARRLTGERAVGGVEPEALAIRLGTPN
jgi:hypothetical protein